MPLYGKTIMELNRLLQARETNPKELLESVLSRIDDREEELNSYITIVALEAEKRAAALQWSEQLPPLWGIPMALKDNIDTAGIRTTCGYEILEHHLPAADAAIAEKLTAAGAILIGKSNMDQFAIGSSTETSDYGPSANPWDMDCVPGGSSGGSAVAVAAGEAIFSIGTDTGGSLRQPAAYCGVVALKPTFGTVNKDGIFPLAPSLDMPGPICRNVEDAALVYEVLSGKSFMPFSEGVEGMRIALPRQYFDTVLDEEALKPIRRAVDVLVAGGAHIEEIDFPAPEMTIGLYQIFCATEAKNIFQNVLFDKKFLGEEIKSRLLFGAFCHHRVGLNEKIQQIRDQLLQTVIGHMQVYDIILGPTTGTPAFRSGENIEPSKMHLSDNLTVMANLTGLPALSLPVGLAEHLPVGLHLMAPHLKEDKLFRVAAYIERAMGFEILPLAIKGDE